MDSKSEFPGRILIVDDDLISSNVISQLLSRKGFEVDSTVRPNQALEMLSKKSYELILLDIYMPEVSGVELLREIKKNPNTTNIPVIMITTSNDGTDLTQSFESGANDYLIKPVNLNAALARIKSQISTKRLNDLKVKMQELNTIRSMTITYHHEINNPLAIAQGLVQVISTTGTAEQKEYARQINGALKRIEITLMKLSLLTRDHQVSFENYSGTSVRKIKL